MNDTDAATSRAWTCAGENRLVLDRVSLIRARRTVLAHVSVDLAPGTLTCLCGPNGAGKSSLLGICAGDLNPAHGSIMLAGEAPGDMTRAEQASRRAVLCQDPALDHPFAVSDVVALGHPDTPVAERHAMLAELGAEALLHRIYTELSGGERRLVQLARVLLQGERASRRTSTPWLFLDEPVSQLDLGRIERVMAALSRRTGRGWGILAAVHDLELASRHAKRLLVLASGRLIADGEPGAALTPAVLEQGWGVRARIERDHPGPGLRIRMDPA